MINEFEIIIKIKNEFKNFFLVMYIYIFKDTKPTTCTK